MAKVSRERLAKADSMFVADPVGFRFIDFPRLHRVFSKNSGLAFLSAPCTNPNHAVSFSFSRVHETIRAPNNYKLPSIKTSALWHKQLLNLEKYYS